MKQLVCRHKWTTIRSFSDEETPFLLRRCARCFEVWNEGVLPEPRIVLGTFEDVTDKD